MTGVRKPKDEAEERRARIAIAQGKGMSLPAFIEDILNEKTGRGICRCSPKPHRICS